MWTLQYEGEPNDGAQNKKQSQTVNFHYVYLFGWQVMVNKNMEAKQKQVVLFVYFFWNLKDAESQFVSLP